MAEGSIFIAIVDGLPAKTQGTPPNHCHWNPGRGTPENHLVLAKSSAKNDKNWRKIGRNRPGSCWLRPSCRPVDADGQIEMRCNAMQSKARGRQGLPPINW